MAKRLRDVCGMKESEPLQRSGAASSCATCRGRRRSFEAMMAREECAKGFFVTFDYTGDALSEISRFFKQTQRVIVPRTVREILDEQIAHKLA